MFFKNFKVWETEFAGRKFSLETGKMAGLANAAFLARYGETEVLCTVTAEFRAHSSAVRAEQVKRLFLQAAALTGLSVRFSLRI